MNDSKRKGSAWGLLLIAAIVFGVAGLEQRKVSRAAARWRTFEVSGRRVPCTPDSTLLARTSLRGGVGTSYEVTCSYDVEGRSYRREFTLDEDPRLLLRRAQSQRDYYATLEEELGSHAGADKRAQLARAAVDGVWQVTYLPTNPQDAVLGSLERAFKVPNVSGPFFFGGAVLALVGFILLLKAHSDARWRQSEQEFG